jgi:alginate O-acetyltransferase complex protein AlgI
MWIGEIFILAGAALALYLFARGAARGWLIYAVSIVCLFWLQPSLPVRYLDFWLPVLTLLLTVLVWMVSLPKGAAVTRSDAAALGVMLGIILCLALTRYVTDRPWLTPSIPPAFDAVGTRLVLGALLLAAFGAARWNYGEFPRSMQHVIFGIIVLLLVMLKSPELSRLLAQATRASVGQDPALAAASDVRWIGFSYISFRLIAVLRDRLAGKLAAYDLRTFVSYVLFFPSLAAGPIDRIERFARDYRQAEKPAASDGTALVQPTAFFAAIAPAVSTARLKAWFQDRPEDVSTAFTRIFWGLFKKFVLADMLALVALNPTNALQVHGAGWLWPLTYFYAFQIYFDFAGYTDIAIGIGMLAGIRLPENFNAPYLKSNLAQFWAAWHISLTQWVRSYLFFPLTRAMRTRKVSAAETLLAGQVATMLVIGLWHGVTWNFFIWGLWHALGLFAQNRWSEAVKPWFAARTLTPGWESALRWIGVAITFNYVALGWIWFVLPSPETSVRVILSMFGMHLP